MASPDFLAQMAAGSTARLAEARRRVPEPELLRRAEARPAPPPLRLSPQGFDLIAEVKRRSPSAGRLAGELLQPVDQASAYAAGGAAALSVLTEPTRFDGDLAHLEAVAAAVAGVPAMRKDFLVAPYQVIEARAAGAGGVLLIAAMLEPAVLRDMLQTAKGLGLFALLEAFDAPDLEVAAAALEGAGPASAGADCRVLVGVNCRDLRTLAVDFGRFEALAGRLPVGVPRVAESGIETPEQAAQVAGLGYDLALVGTALMRAGDPAATTAALLAAGRGAARCS